MSFIKNQVVSQAARLSKVLQANSVHEASNIGKCLKLCESLGINEFSYRALAKLVDLRPSLGSNECMLARVSNPESFVVVSQEGSYLAPLVEIEDKVIWAFEEEADYYTENPTIMNNKDIFVLSTRRGD